MRLSFDWLCDFVDLSGLTPQEVADKLTRGAFEVEEVRKVGPDIEGQLVVGEIVEINPHPNADKIRLTKINIDAQAEPLEIVCGASNIIVGQRVPVALVGAKVVNRHDGTALHIKPTKIRGVESNGMLCSAAELGITSGEDGIHILYGMPTVGADVKKLLNLYPDYVLHVEPRSNRGDALSVIGLAREVAAFCKRDFIAPHWELPREDMTSEAVQIYIENEQDCPYFSMRIIQGIYVKESPLTLIRRLEAIGVRPVNNVVDVTNYVLHEMGQPLHAYDLATLKGPVIEVRRAAKGERLLTLDGRERELNEEVLAIADSQKVVGLAGVMGGKDSEISQETGFVALEAAAFHAARVRRAGRLLGVSSDSSLRFERGVDVANVKQASDRASFLILQNCGGFLGRYTYKGNDQVKPVPVDLRPGRIKQLLEIDLNANEVGELLLPLGFKSSVKDEKTLTVEVPSFRQKDVSREIDLIEEVCRCYGYDQIPTSMPRNTIAPSTNDRTADHVRDVLAACGLSEACTSSLTRRQQYETGDGNGAEGSVVAVLNPLSEDHQVLRQSLIPGLVRALAYNQDHGRKDVWLFEIGRSYRATDKASNRNSGVTEELLVSGAISGSRTLSKWQKSQGQSEQPDFFTSKGVVENLLSRLSIPLTSVHFASANLPPHFHPGLSCLVETHSQKQILKLGWLGQLHPALADAHDFRQPVYLFEFKLSALKEAAQERQFQEIHNTPFVVRDLTVDITQEIEQQPVREAILQSAGEHLKALELVSVFELAGNKKSLSYRLTFQHPELTLTAEQIDQNLLKIRQALSQKLPVSFRA